MAWQHGLNRWQVVSGEWRVVSGEWRVVSGEGTVGLVRSANHGPNQLAWGRRRDVRREVPPGPPSAHPSDGAQAWLEDSGPTPIAELEREGDLARLAEALAALPGDQRRAVEMHHLQGLPFAEVAARMGRSKASVAGLGESTAAFFDDLKCEGEAGRVLMLVY